MTKSITSAAMFKDLHNRAPLIMNISHSRQALICFDNIRLSEVLPVMHLQPFLVIFITSLHARANVIASASLPTILSQPSRIRLVLGAIQLMCWPSNSSDPGRFQDSNPPVILIPQIEQSLFDIGCTIHLVTVYVWSTPSRSPIFVPSTRNLLHEPMPLSQTE